MKSNRLIQFGILFVFLNFACVFPVFSQSNSIRIIGSVVNEQDEIIKGAAILIKQSTTGTVTDLSGNFSLDVPSLPIVLLVSYIGYDTQEVQVNEADGTVKVKLTQTQKTNPSPTEPEPIYQAIDQTDEIPQPIGGREEWHKYIAKNIVYPANDRKSGIQGVVLAVFNVTSEGKVQDVELLRGIGGECDQEVIRVISASPDWIPAKQDGKPVQSRMRVPILFRVDSDKQEDIDKWIKEKTVSEAYGRHFVVVGYSSPSSTK